MDWSFELVAGPFEGATDGLAWDGQAMLFTNPSRNLLLRYNPSDAQVSEVRKYTNMTAGLAFAASGELYGAQQMSRRIVRFNSDGSTSAMAYRFAGLPYHGSFHNMPKYLAVDPGGRIWFSDPHPDMLASGPPLPFPDHQSVLRLDMQTDRSWVLRRMTHDTHSPSGIAVSPDGNTLYVADRGADASELRAYPVQADGSLGQRRVLHTFGSDSQGRHRGAQGLCVDVEGNIIVCAGSSAAGPGPMIYVFAPGGRVIDTQPLPLDVAPANCAFGDLGLTSLYVTTEGGHLYRVRDTGRKGYAVYPQGA